MHFLSNIKNSKPERFLDFSFTAIQCTCSFLGLLTNWNDRFPNPLIYFNKWNPYPFIYLKPEKGTGQNSSEKPILLSRRISLTGQFWLLVSALRFKCKKKIIAVTDGKNAVMKRKPQKNSGLQWYRSKTVENVSRQYTVMTCDLSKYFLTSTYLVLDISHKRAHTRLITAGEDKEKTAQV